MDFGTSSGLALSSGINAYLPLLSLVLSAKLGLHKINPGFAFMEQGWFIAILVVLSLADLFADKIPIVDHVWDAIHTVIRPIAGALVSVASGNQTTGAGVSGLVVLGASLAGAVHITKASTRVASTVTTAGCANIGLSFFEDILAIGGIVLSFVAPVVMIVVAVVFVIVFLLLFSRIMRAFRRWWRKPDARTTASWRS